MARAVVLHILDELAEEEFKRFKFYLQEHDILEGNKAIPRVNLERADRVDTVKRMMEIYTTEVLEITKEILIRMSRNDLVQMCSSGPEGQLHKVFIIHKNVYST